MLAALPFLLAVAAAAPVRSASALAAAPLAADADVPVPVADNVSRLLREFDVDDDSRITVDDHPSGSFDLIDEQGGRREVSGVYPLSVLLQELSLARDRGEKAVVLPPARLDENIVDRTHRMISGLFWDSLTRRVDEEGLGRVLDDPKAASADGLRRLYVPAGDDGALAYFRDVARRRPELKLAVETLEHTGGFDGRQGLLSLALKRMSDGRIAGEPFVVPGGRFNEMYGWDTHFIILGLLEDGRLDLARSMVDDQVYEIGHYGKILNANRTYYLTRSQPPLLTSTLAAIEPKLPPGPENDAWLARGLEAAIAEYRTVWTARPRLVGSTGLSRYDDEGHGPCPEVEPGHYDPILRPYAEKAGLTPDQYLAAYDSGTIKNPALDAFFLQDRAERESGHDTTYRFDDRATDFLTVDLNSLLYKTETDVADLLDKRFGGALNGESSSRWRARAEARKKRMNELFWDATRGLFFDYDLKNRRRSGYVSATGLYPLWAGWATPEQAAAAKTNSLRELERLGGLAATAESSRGPLSAERPARQWDYPYGWPPHQILAWEGLARYGFADDERRLAYRWLWTIVKNARDYNGTVPEKYDVVKASHQVFAEYGNVGTKFAYITKEGFGWMNASYELGLKILTPELMARLRSVEAPGRVFNGSTSAAPPSSP
ncbi:MAG TPA: trehalase family glycosidase [Elusimicrobiota bacterium]|nr:trehalase family glycosidase [Elusimicrobiota bacterium]